jgi:hypothetical protein
LYQNGAKLRKEIIKEDMSMRNQSTNYENIEELVDIQDVVIDTSKPVMEKKKSFFEQIKNPNCFRFDDMVVRVSFMSIGPTLKDRIKQYLLSGQGMKLSLT